MACNNGNLKEIETVERFPDRKFITLQLLPKLLTSPPRTLANKKIRRDPNTQIVSIHDTTCKQQSV